MDSVVVHTIDWCGGVGFVKEGGRMSANRSCWWVKDFGLNESEDCWSALAVVNDTHWLWLTEEETVSIPFVTNLFLTRCTPSLLSCLLMFQRLFSCATKSLASGIIYIFLFESYDRQREPPHSERDTTSPTPLAVDAERCRTTFKRRRVLRVDTLRPRRAISIGAKRPRADAPQVLVVCDTPRPCLADSRMVSERERRPRNRLRLRLLGLSLFLFILMHVWLLCYLAVVCLQRCYCMSVVENTC